MAELAYSITEAAAALGISRPTMYQLIKREGFPSFRVGGSSGRVLIPKKGLERWVSAQCGEEQKDEN